MANLSDRSEAVRPHTKRMGREVAMQYLYACESKGELPSAATFDAFFETLNGEYQLRDERLIRKAREFATELYELEALHQEEIDAMLRPRCEESWGWDRIDAVDRNVLRVALTEILYCGGAPLMVCIDEAVEIARDFSGAEGGRFVNGVLNALKDDLAKAAAKAK